MKIDSASISMTASHRSLIRHEVDESLKTWRNNSRPENISLVNGNDSQVRISTPARTALAAETRSKDDLAASAAQKSLDESSDTDPFLSMVKSMIEFLTGRPMKLFSSADLQRMPETQEAAPRPSAQTRPPSGAGFAYDRREVYEEIETASFSAKGMIRTQDGVEISFQLDIQMERRYREVSHVSLRSGNPAPTPVRKDPLVINFAGMAAQLHDQHFRFDLDVDGREDSLPQLASGSGYLVFDRNQNGRIDDGSELFGPSTGHGFTELAALDADGNGWIDEADPLFSQLGVWRPDDPQGPTTLAANGIGALALANLATPFELRGNGNSNLGAVLASGFALTEDGRALGMQEIDLTVG